MRLQADEVTQVADRVPDKMFGTKELQDLVDTMVATMREAPGGWPCRPSDRRQHAGV